MRLMRRKYNINVFNIIIIKYNAVYALNHYKA